ncbi:Uncharacterised protein [Mycobacteroides abscessus]|nr:Uncharacterised protein [Mycobacteroides abscessus]
MSPAARKAHGYPLPASPVCSTTLGPRSACPNNMPTTATTPTISQVTPMELIRDIQLTPTALMAVVATKSNEPSSTALDAPLTLVSEESVPMS